MTIVDTLASWEIDTLVVGSNPEWKQEVNIGKHNNQNFLSTPHDMLKGMLAYRCAKAGIAYVEQEESYTSKASFLDMDDIPAWDGEHHSYKFSGTRRGRGLYKSKATGEVINADLNGSANILRKAYPDAFSWTASELPDFKSTVVVRHPEKDINVIPMG